MPLSRQAQNRTAKTRPDLAKVCRIRHHRAEEEPEDPPAWLGRGTTEVVDPAKIGVAEGAAAFSRQRGRRRGAEEFPGQAYAVTGEAEPGISAAARPLLREGLLKRKDPPPRARSVARVRNPSG